MWNLWFYCKTLGNNASNNFLPIDLISETAALNVSEEDCKRITQISWTACIIVNSGTGSAQWVVYCHNIITISIYLS